MANALYRGFSTANYLATKQSFRLTNVDIVKRDLLLHIYTRKGERVMMPNFGTTIPDLLFEPLDDQTVDEVRTQLNYVFNYDPRVAVVELNVFPVPDTNMIIASAVLQYLELNMTGQFNLHLEFNSQT